MPSFIKRQLITERANFKPGRSWRNPIDCIVIHVTEGSAASVRSWFNDPAAQVSAHYMVQMDGAVIQFVDEYDTAYHAGQLVTPANALVRARFAEGGFTPNSYAIGIEHEGDGKHEMTDAQRAASYSLIRDIRTRHPVPLDRQHVIAHHEVKASKTCPGAIDVDRIVADVIASGTGGGTVAVTLPATPAAIPDVVYSKLLGALIPVTVTSDTVWTFARVSDIRDALKAGRAFTTMEAGTPLSDMPRTPS